VFFIAVALSAWNGGLGPGLLATGFGTAAGILLPIAAPGSEGFAVADALSLVVFLTVSSLIALITEGLDRVNQALGGALADVRSSEARNRSVIDSVVEGLVLISPDGRVASVNGRFETLMGLHRADVEGRDIESLRPDFERIFEDPAAVATALATAEADKDRATIVAQAWPQPRQLALFATTVRSDDEALGRLFGFRDVTQERELDRMKTEFVSQVSHELRTPLTAIKGFTDLMLDGDAGDLNEEQTDYLQTVKSNADRLVALINDLLDVSRIESGRITLKSGPLDVPAILKEVVTTMRPLLDGKQQTLALTVEPDLPTAYGDHDRVVQVATNLVSNAHKYTQSGGAIEVAATHAAGFVRVAVRDNGMGIGPDDMPKLFTRFFRVDSSITRSIGGTGLGLSIVKSIVEMQGGTVSVESELGVGSVFAFTIPVATEPAATETADADTAGAEPAAAATTGG
jgi:PAS domain S-box-containing protein